MGHVGPWPHYHLIEWALDRCNTFGSHHLQKFTPHIMGDVTAWIESPLRSFYFWLLFSLCWLNLANFITSQLNQDFWADRHFSQTLQLAASKTHCFLKTSWSIRFYQYCIKLLTCPYRVKNPSCNEADLVVNFRQMRNACNLRARNEI